MSRGGHKPSAYTSFFCFVLIFLRLFYLCLHHDGSSTFLLRKPSELRHEWTTQAPRHARTVEKHCWSMKKEGRLMTLPSCHTFFPPLNSPDAAHLLIGLWEIKLGDWIFVACLVNKLMGCRHFLTCISYHKQQHLSSYNRSLQLMCLGSHYDLELILFLIICGQK